MASHLWRLFNNSIVCDILKIHILFIPNKEIHGIYEKQVIQMFKEKGGCLW